MADFGSTNKNSTFEEWYDQLQQFAELNMGSSTDAEAWREDYDAGKTPTDAWFDENPDDGEL